MRVAVLVMSAMTRVGRGFEHCDSKSVRRPPHPVLRAFPDRTALRCGRLAASLLGWVSD